MSLQMQERGDIGMCPSFNTYSTGTIAHAATRAGGDDDDFEFVSLHNSTDRDELNAPVFPIFNSDLLFEVERAEVHDPDSGTSFENVERRDLCSSSSSSSSVDELEGVPKRSSMGSPNLDCRKSRSTGSLSTKRWGIRDLLRRSHSDGKHSYISFTPSASANPTEAKSPKNLKEKKRVFSAHESFYVRNRGLKEEGKRKSYLPYKPHLVGCWRTSYKYS